MQRVLRHSLCLVNGIEDHLLDTFELVSTICVPVQGVVSGWVGRKFIRACAESVQFELYLWIL